MRAITQGRVQMREIKVRTIELLEKVRANKEKHVREYKEAVQGYKELAADRIQRAALKATEELGRASRHALEQVERMTDKDIEEGLGNVIVLLQQVAFTLQVPESHEKDYDQVIMQLEMCVDNTIMVMSDEFACFCMDDWDWKQDFKKLSSTYGMENVKRLIDR